MTRIRVLQIITRMILGGAQETALFTAECLDHAVFEVDLLTGPQTGSEGSLIEASRKRNISLRILPELVREIAPLKDLIALCKLYQFIRAGNYQIVHTHSSKAGILGRIAARLAHTPVIIHTVHGWSFQDHMPPLVRWGYIFLERICASFTDALIVVTRQDQSKGLACRIGRPEKYHLIRSAIPVEEFTPSPEMRLAARNELRLPLDAPVLGNVGRFSAQKNPLDWVQVASRISKILPSCRFLLVGDGPLRNQVQSALQAAGLAEKTILTGLRSDPARMMAAMDVFLLTSLWEGLPRVIPQAMLMGLPVVATQVDGSLEAIQPGVTGFSSPPGDLDGLTRSCLELLLDRELRLEIGQAARVYALSEFDLKRMIAQLEQLYLNQLEIK